MSIPGQVDQRKFDQLLQNLVVKAMLPLHFIDDEPFQDFVKGNILLTFCDCDVANISFVVSV